MGTSRSVGELVSKIDRVSARINNAPEEGVRRAAARLEAQALANMRRATGGDLQLSGLNTSKKQQARLAAGRAARGKLGVASRVVRSGSTGNAEAFVRVTGPAQLVERDVRPHFVYPDSARVDGYRTKTRSFATGALTASGKARRQRVDTRNVAASLGMNVNVGRARLHFGNVYMVRTKASSKGRYPWRDARREVEPEIPKIVFGQTARALGEVFK